MATCSLLYQAELAILWSVDEARAPHAFIWEGLAPIEPYSLMLADGRAVVGFSNPDGRRVEVIGKPGIR
ncbi:MAG: hypothetical protein L0H83_13120, partial [Salinisphaera sp.]|nr:hypothetical protein [Salinisphaera sp.]